nr:MAG TPA: hypothetical protein [Bacteriophage sp.]
MNKTCIIPIAPILLSNREQKLADRQSIISNVDFPRK